MLEVDGGGSPGLKCELRAEPGRNSTEHAAARSASIFPTGAAESGEKKQPRDSEGRKPGDQSFISAVGPP